MNRLVSPDHDYINKVTKLHYLHQVLVIKYVSFFITIKPKNQGETLFCIFVYQNIEAPLI